MDLSVISLPVCEYSPLLCPIPYSSNRAALPGAQRQGTGLRFSIRSASSPSYTPLSRLDLGKREGLFEEEKREGANTEEVRGSGRRGEEAQSPPPTQREKDKVIKDNMDTSNQGRTETHSCLNSQSEGKCTSGSKMVPGQLSQNGSVSEVNSERSSDRSGNWSEVRELAGARGRMEQRRLDLTSRSKSVDWRAGRLSPDKGSRTGVLGFSGNLQGTTAKRAESLERRGAGEKDRVEGGEKSVLSRMKVYNSAGSGAVVGERSPVEGALNGQSGSGWYPGQRALERASGGQSLPYRLKPQSGSGSGPGLRDPTSGSTGARGQSIWDRIERLYGSAGPDKATSGDRRGEDSTRTKRNSAPVEDWLLPDLEGGNAVANRRKSTTDPTFVSSSSSPFSSPLSQWRRVSYEGETGGTFPRRFSMGERNSLNTPQHSQTTTHTPLTHTLNSDQRPTHTVSPLSLWTRDRAPRLQRQGQAYGRHPGESEDIRGRGALEQGTRSLDRDCSKFTVAVQIRSARDADTHTVSQGEEKGRKNGISEGSVNERERIGSSAQKTEKVGELEKEKQTDVEGGKEDKKEAEKRSKNIPEGGVNTGSKLHLTNQMNRSASTDTPARAMTFVRGVAREESRTEDVFESNTQKITLQSSEKKMFPEKLVVPSAAGVRNKIHQFEALTQRAQGLVASVPFLKPRRAFSVPEQPSGAGEGVKKSGSDKTLGGVRTQWEGVREGGEGGSVKGEGERAGGEGVRKSRSDKAMGGVRGGGGGGGGGEAEKRAEKGWPVRSVSVDAVGVRLGGEGERSRGESGAVGAGTFPELKDKPETPPNSRTKLETVRGLQMDEPDFPKAPNPENTHTVPTQDSARRGIYAKDTSSAQLLNINNNNGVLQTPGQSGVPYTLSSSLPSPVTDDDKTPTNTPQNSPFHPNYPYPEDSATDQTDPESTPVSIHTAVSRSKIHSDSSTPSSTDASSSPVSHSGLGRDSLCLPLSLPLTSSSPSAHPHQRGDYLDMCMARLSQERVQWSDEDDDEGTEKDEDSNYDSDSAESSVTITSNMSQSDRRSFSLSLADLCNFGGVDYESSEADSEDWSSGRSASLSSDVSALSCVSVLGSEELDRLLEDVRGLGDSTLQNYEDVQVVVLHKEVGVGLGFTMAGGVDQNKPVTVHKVFPSGVAAQEGSIMEGDQVLSINGTSLCGSAHWEVLRTLRRSRTRGMGVVVLKRGGVRGPCKAGAETDTQGWTRTQPSHTGSRVCVRLEKRSRDLGFSLEGGVGSKLGDRPITIQKIFLGGPVTEVCPGDEVMEIQGVSVVGMRRLEAWTLIRKLPPGPVEMILHRPLKPQ